VMWYMVFFFMLGIISIPWRIIRRGHTRTKAYQEEMLRLARQQAVRP
jgi:hypothetical protein